MDYKVICTDIDGTLLDKNRELSIKTITEVNRIKSLVPVILVSSRMPKAMRHLQKTLGIEHFPIIAYNGGLVLTYDESDSLPQIFLSIPISVEIPSLIFKRTMNSNIHTSLYLFDDWFVEEEDYWALREIHNTKVKPTTANFKLLIDTWQNARQAPHKIMCMGPESEISDLEHFLNVQVGQKLNLYRSKPTYLEISSKLVSKAVAIRKLLDEKMGIRMHEAIAFGDNYNDIEMIEAVGLGIAVSNGNDALKTVADEITLSNVEDGVALSIEKYFP